MTDPTQVQFELQPCRLRQDRIVPQKDAEPVVFDWQGLCARLAPSGATPALVNLHRLREGMFVGLLRHPKRRGVTNFILQNLDKSSSFGWLLRQDPTFETRLVEVWRVEHAETGARLRELT